jgi:hypothetical protein
VRTEPNLDEYPAKLPPIPPFRASRCLTVEGVPARVRLVVVAPLGKGASINEAGVEELLNHIRWGLAAITHENQAPIRIWPPQLSAHGFPAVFHRKIHLPDPEGQPSQWVLLAGPTPPRPRSLMLGLVLWTEEPTNIGRLTLEPNQWMRSLSLDHLENQPAAGAAVPDPSAEPSAAPPVEPSGAEAGSRRVPETNGVPPGTGLTLQGGP